MICHKCGFGYMVDDSHRDIKVLRCWVCGERIYPDHPKRSGALVCSRCGDELAATNASGLCTNCSRYHGIGYRTAEGAQLRRNRLHLRYDVHQEKPRAALSLPCVQKTDGKNSDFMR